MLFFGLPRAPWHHGACVHPIRRPHHRGPGRRRTPNVGRDPWTAPRARRPAAETDLVFGDDDGDDPYITPADGGDDDVSLGFGGGGDDDDDDDDDYSDNPDVGNAECRLKQSYVRSLETPNNNNRRTPKSAP